MAVLDQVREPWRIHSAKAILAYVIFGLICLMFVFTGLTPDRFGAATGAGIAATVNQTTISTRDLQDAVKRYESQMGSDKGMPAAQRQLRDQRIRENALQELVSYEVVYQSAVGAGVMPTDAATRNLIVNIPAFQEDGRFARDNYKRYLDYRNISAGEFESKIQRDIVIGQVRDIFFAAWATPPILEDLQSEARETKINLEIIKIDPKTLADAAVSEADVQQFLAKPENKEKAKTYYNSHNEQFSAPEQVHARHILLKGDSDAVLKKAQELKKQLTKANFADLAKKNSEDEGSKDRGGDLNYFGRGQMVPEFEKVAFSLPLGQVSEPVKSTFGYHLILVEDKKAASAQKLEDVEKSIAKTLIAEERRDQVSEEFAKVLKEKKDVSSLAAKYKLKWQDVGAVSLTQTYIDKVEAGEAVIEAAVGLKAGETYPDLVRSGAQSYIVRVKGLVAANKKADAPKTANPYARYGGGGEVLGLWAEELRKEARIRLNDSVLK